MKKYLIIFTFLSLSVFAMDQIRYIDQDVDHFNREYNQFMQDAAKNYKENTAAIDHELRAKVCTYCYAQIYARIAQAYQESEKEHVGYNPEIHYFAKAQADLFNTLRNQLEEQNNV